MQQHVRMRHAGAAWAVEAGVSMLPLTQLTGHDDGLAT
jgi:hypothetical protein